MLYNFYRILGAVCYPFLILTAPLFERLVPNWQTALRLGQYQDDQNTQDRNGSAAGSKNGPQLIWIHAASVGEVQAARTLIAILLDTLPAADFFFTTMTGQGRAVARSLLPSSIRCELAPLDIPQAVDRALRILRPSLYICLETELWPVMLTKMRQAGVPMLLLNGRISERSFRQYQRIQKTAAELLTGFAAVGVIREQDGERFRRLGVSEDRIQVCGNMKYDLPPEQAQEKEERDTKDSARFLNIQSDELVFICGSTRTGEEELLLPVYLRLQKMFSGNKLLWLLAPRHIERLPRVRALLDRAGLEYELFSKNICFQPVSPRAIILR